MRDGEGIMRKIYGLIFIIVFLFSGVSVAQVIDKVGDQYVIGAMLSTRAEQEAIIAQAQAEIANANAYCQRQLTECETAFIIPQEEAITRAQNNIAQFDLIDQFGTTNVGGGGPDYGEGVNWSVDGGLYQ